MPRLIDLTGERFGRLSVVERAADVPSWPGAHWRCQCDCGQDVVVYGQSLRRGNTRSCGCLEAESKATNLRHGYGKDGKKSPEYLAWVNMRQRCNNPNHPGYQDYGGRGITVDPRWDSFAQFLEDVGPRPTSMHSLDRNDNMKGYSPENCYWVTRDAQMRNRRTVGMLSMDRLPEYIEDCVKFLEEYAPDKLR